MYTDNVNGCKRRIIILFLIAQQHGRREHTKSRGAIIRCIISLMHV
jgi:hypothetical protein